MDEMNNKTQEELMEEFVNMLNDKYAEPKEAYDKAYEDYAERLVNLQDVLSATFENRDQIMSTEIAHTISHHVEGFSNSDLVKLFTKAEASPVVSSVGNAKALWDAACCTIGKYIDLKDDEGNLGLKLHVTASIMAIFELLQHALAFANFEDTVDQEEYFGYIKQFESIAGITDDRAIKEE